MPRGMKRATLILRVAIALGALGAGCLYDEAHRCGPNEVLDANEVCVCAPDTVPVYRDIVILQPATPTEKPPFSSCRFCAAHEVVKGDQCVCALGYVASPSGCTPSNLGATCGGDADCATGDQTFCRLPEGYCTKRDCTANADCNAAADYACVTTDTPAYCRRPPVGQGAACTMQGPDPACTMEAPLCVLNKCTPSGCKADSECTPSRKCCDLTKFGQPGLTICFPGACP